MRLLVAAVLASGCAVDVSELVREQSLTEHSVVLDKASYSPGEAIAVSFAGFPGTSSDWIAISRVTDADNVFMAWTYTDGGTDGSVQFALNLPAGDYEARGYFDWLVTQDYVVQARAPFTVAVAAPPIVTTDAWQYAPNANVTVSYSGLAGSPGDWIGVFAPDAPSEQFVRFKYTNGDSTGSLIFEGLPNGEYVTRSFNNDTYEIVAQSQVFVIGDLITTKPNFAPDELIVANFRGLRPHPLNWVGLAPVGTPSSTFIAYRYVDTSSGQVTFNGLAEGTYEVRVYLEDSYDISGKATFTVGTPPPPAAVIATNKPSYEVNEPITVNYVVTGNPLDWVALSTAGSPATDFIRFVYLDPTGVTTFGGLAAGDYEARFYSDDSYNIVSFVTFSVVAPPTLPPVTLTVDFDQQSRKDIKVDYTGLGGTADWISLARAGTADTEYVRFAYTNGVADGRIKFAQLPAGNYEVRAMRNDSYTVEMRASFVVEDPGNGNGNNSDNGNHGDGNNGNGNGNGP